MNGYNCFIGRGAQRQAKRYAPIKIVFGKHLTFLRESVICFMLKTPYSGTFVKSPRQKCKRLHRKVKSRKTCSETKNAHSYPNTAGSLYAKRIFAAGGKYANRFCAGSTPSYAQRLSHIYFEMIYRIRLYCKHSRFFGGLVYFSAHYPLPTPARRRIVNAAAIQKSRANGTLLFCKYIFKHGQQANIPQRRHPQGSRWKRRSGGYSRRYRHPHR